MVDPLTAAAAEQAALPGLDERARRAKDAQAQLTKAQADYDQAHAKLNSLREQRWQIASRALEIREGIDPHEHAARQHANAALDRARDLYTEHGTSPHLVGYYISDMRESAGLASMAEDPYQRYDPTRHFLEGKALRVKVKRNGPDAGPTRAAAAAAQQDPTFQKELAAFNAERQAAKDIESQARMVEGEMRRGDEEYSAAVRAETAAGRERAEAARAAERAAEDLERARLRAASNIPVDGQDRQVDNSLAADIYVNSDGATNLWEYRSGNGSAAPTYERVYAKVNEGSTELVTSDGRKVRRSTHYANFTSSVTQPEVFVGPAEGGARSIRDYPKPALEVVIDSGD